MSQDAIFNWNRSDSLHKFYRGSNRIVEQKRAFPNVNYRHLFLEKDAIDLPLDFRNQTTWPYQMQGREDAQKVLNNPDFDGFLHLDEWRENEKYLGKPSAPLLSTITHSSKTEYL